MAVDRLRYFLLSATKLSSFQQRILRALWEKNRSDPPSKMGSQAKGGPSSQRGAQSFQADQLT